MELFYAPQKGQSGYVWNILNAFSANFSLKPNRMGTRCAKRTILHGRLKECASGVLLGDAACHNE